MVFTVTNIYLLQNLEGRFLMVYSNLIARYVIILFENITDNTDMLRDEECITKLIKKVFEDEFKKTGANVSKNN